MITFKIEKYFYNIIEKNKPKMRKIDNKYLFRNIIADLPTFPAGN